MPAPASAGVIDPAVSAGRVWWEAELYSALDTQLQEISRLTALAPGLRSEREELWRQRSAQGLILDERVRLLAHEVAIATGGDAEWLHQEWADLSKKRLTVIIYGLAQVGKDYTYASRGPSAFDCSGLTAAAWAAVGVAIPLNSRDQGRLLPSLTRARPGSLVVRQGHVVLYLGAGIIVHAANEALGVRLDTVEVPTAGIVDPLGGV
jgi:cell wall-associated NlpC family hydrolase